MSVECPKCNTENTSDSQFCKSCATPLPSSKEIPVTETIEAPKEDLVTGSAFAGRYQIIKELGQGGMGRVYLAHDKKLDRDVALKFLDESFRKDDKARERLLREAKSAAALDHPFICKIYDADESEDKTFIVMEFVKGEDLSERMNKKPLSLKEIFRIVSEVAEALEEAHKKGIVHRDLKPGNIMITPQGHAKVMDFGIAKRISTEDEMLTRTMTKDTLTHEGSIIGTLAYMSPEQARGERVDSRSDIFSLGIIFYELLSGKQPFLRGNTAETLTAILRDQPSSISVKPKKLYPVVDKILQKSLAKDPQERYQGVSEFCAEVKNAQSEIAVRGLSLFRSWPMILITSASMALILIGVLWLAWFRNIGKVKELPEPRRVVVADFQNKTGDQVFEGALEQAMCIGLEGAPFISIYKRGDAKKVANEISGKEDGKMDENLAQLVSRREGIALVVAGIIESKKEGYNIKIWAVDPVNSNKVMESSESIRRKEQVFRAIDNLSEKLRSDLGENIKQSSQRRLVETFTTKSIEAMKAYAQAQDLQTLGKYNESIEYYRKAIENDPDFGRAYSGLAVSSSNLGKKEDASKYIEIALSHLDRMSEREKLRTRGWHYLMKENYEKAKEEYSMLAELYPADVVAHINLSVAFWGLKDYKSAINQSKIVAELDPNDAINYYNLCEYAWLAGEFELSVESGKKVWEINPEYEGPYLYYHISNSQVGLGQPEGAEETLQRLQENFPDNEIAKRIAERGFLNLALYEGRLNDAKEILQRQIFSALDEKKTDVLSQKRIELSKILILQKNRSQAVKNLDIALSSVIKEDNWELLFEAAHVYLKLSLLDKAASLVTKIERPRNYKDKHSEAEAKALARIIEGEINISRGDRLKAEEEFGKAIRLLREAKNINDRWIYRYYLGYVYLKKEEFTEAHSEFELCIKRIQEATNPEYYAYIPLVHYYLGQVQEGLKSQAAIDSYAKFLDIKKRGDSGILVEDAKKRLAVLKQRIE